MATVFPVPVSRTSLVNASTSRVLCGAQWFAVKRLDNVAREHAGLCGGRVGHDGAHNKPAGLLKSQYSAYSSLSGWVKTPSHAVSSAFLASSRSGGASMYFWKSSVW